MKLKQIIESGMNLEKSVNEFIENHPEYTIISVDCSVIHYASYNSMCVAFIVYVSKE